MSERIFKKSNTDLWAFAVLFFLSLIHFSFEAAGHHLPGLRAAVSVAVTPIQLTVDYPLRLWRLAGAMMGKKTNLLQENMELRAQQVLLEAKLQHFIALKAENSQLKALLQTTESSHTKAIAAQILEVEINRLRQLLVLDKGWRDGILLGQAVLDAKGVMGQIIDVGYGTSTVLLISDLKSAVPIRNARTGEWGIVMGSNEATQLTLLNLPKTSPIQPGDVLMTSGLGGHYPEGYPVGRVSELQHVEGDPFIHVTVTPIARLMQSQLVLVLLSDGKSSDLLSQIHTRLNVLGNR